ncbi:MAG: endonuclease V [Nanoarchaeota archaeon]|nr:endonuclease V [Nanoarchaeota archaeon]MBU4086716.1 endonuclease V [Nanoarchaeota archaeon]
MEEDYKREERVREIIQKYRIDIKKLESEQEKLAKSLEIKDSTDFSKLVKIGGFSNAFSQNKIISAAVVLDSEMEILEQKYFSDKVRFPYLSGFRAYRELPAMASCFDLLEDKPEVVFIFGHGISHPRLGLASHFSLSTGIPSIGVSESLLIGDVEGENVFYNKKVIAKVLNIKPGSKPLYVSPGNLISMNSAYTLAKKFVKLPHKLPEPLHLAHKYSKQVAREISV